MAQDNRTFIIFKKHRRFTRLWQFLFTGWGLVMVAALAAGAVFTKQLIWTPISAINMIENHDEQMVLRYRYIHNMTWKQIGAKLNVSEKTIRRWHDNALSKVVIPKDYTAA